MSFSAERARVLTADEIDGALSDMARAADLLIRECDSEERRRDELDDLNEALIERRANSQGSMTDAESVLLSVRLRLATDSAKRSRDAAREFVSWWADAATVAWRAAVLDTPVQHARLVGAAPDTMLTDEELAVLPKVDEHTRRVVELGVSFSPPPSAEADDQDPAAMAADLTAGSGLRIRRTDTGAIEVIEGSDPEARRCRLWGDFWIGHRIPALPEPSELEELFSRTASEVETRLRAAVKAVVQAMAAGSRMDKLEDKGERWTSEEIDEYDRLMEHRCSLTVLLADYARVITDSLATLRHTNRGEAG